MILGEQPLPLLEKIRKGASATSRLLEDRSNTDSSLRGASIVIGKKKGRMEERTK